MSWYTELWDDDGKQAKWHGQLPNVEAVEEMIKKKKAHEIVRFRKPIDAVPSDMDRLRALGAELL
jgi:hypothetical protein